MKDWDTLAAHVPYEPRHARRTERALARGARGLRRHLRVVRDRPRLAVPMTVATILARLACAYVLLIVAWLLVSTAVEKRREMRAERDDDRAAVERAYRQGGWS